MQKQSQNPVSAQQLKDLHARQNYLLLNQLMTKRKMHPEFIDELSYEVLYDLGAALLYGYFGLNKNTNDAKKYFQAILQKSICDAKKTHSTPNEMLVAKTYSVKSKQLLRVCCFYQYRHHCRLDQFTQAYEHIEYTIGLTRGICKDTQLPRAYAELAEAINLLLYNPALTEERKLKLLEEEAEANVKAIEGGDCIGLYNYAIDLKNGSAVIKQNQELAVQYLTRSAQEGGYALAWNELGCIYVCQGPTFYAQALTCFQKAAENGEASGYANLASFIQTQAAGHDPSKIFSGEITTVTNLPESLYTNQIRKLTTLGAEGGSVLCAANLGINHLNGSFGYPEDPVQALYWFIVGESHETQDCNLNGQFRQFIALAKKKIHNHDLKPIIERALTAKSTLQDAANYQRDQNMLARIDKHFGNIVRLKQPDLDRSYELEFSSYVQVNRDIIDAEQSVQQASDIITLICATTLANKVNIVNYTTAIHRIGAAFTRNGVSTQPILINFNSIVQIFDRFITHLRSARGTNDVLEWRSFCAALHGLSALRLHPQFPRYEALVSLLLTHLSTILSADTNQKITLLHSLSRMPLTIEQAKIIYHSLTLEYDALPLSALVDALYSMAILHCSHPMSLDTLRSSVQQCVNHINTQLTSAPPSAIQRALMLATAYWQTKKIIIGENIQTCCAAPLPQGLCTLSNLQRDITQELLKYQPSLVIEHEQDALSYDIYFPKQQVALQVQGRSHYCTHDTDLAHPTPRQRLLSCLSRIPVVEIIDFEWDRLPQSDRFAFLKHKLHGKVHIELVQQHDETHSKTKPENELSAKDDEALPQLPNAWEDKDSVRNLFARK